MVAAPNQKFVLGAIPFVEDVDARCPRFPEQVCFVQDDPAAFARSGGRRMWNKFEDCFVPLESFAAYAATWISIYSTRADHVVSQFKSTAGSAGV